MSSRRYQEDIRRIVGLQDTLRGLDDELPRMRIEGARGIFLIGAGETKSGAAPGVDEDGEATDPIMPDENEDNKNEDGSGTGGSGTDPAETDGSDLEIDPEDSGNFSPDDSTFGGGWASGGVSTFSDCASGKCIEIVERGGYVPPEGWDDADTPSYEEAQWEYLPGTYWAGGGRSLTASGAKANMQAAYPNICDWEKHPIFKNRWDARIISQISGLCVPTSLGIIRLDCNTDPDPICETDPPDNPYKWPSDDCIQLSQNADGNWQASNSENPEDMTAKYSEAKSILDLCAPNGDGVQILPGADGGSVRWNYTQGRFMATSPEGRRSFGGATELTTAVAGSVKDGGAIKAQGAPVPTT